jgi:hypothetical protein
MLEEKYGILTDRELDIFFEGLSMGQRVTATHVNNQFKRIKAGANVEIVKGVVSKLNEYISEIIIMTRDNAKRLYENLL